MALPVTPATAGIAPIQGAPDFGATDPTYSVKDVYAPLQDLLAKQQATASANYATNSANLKNIFGALTGISAADTKRINDQFASSITKQQADLATRTAEQRAAQAAGAAQATATGAERGNGPALVGSPTATATNQAIGQSNAIQQNWEGLMGAQQANAITDITNRGAGYGQQQVSALQQLTKNYNEQLAGLDQQAANLDSQIAQANIAKQQAIASNNFEAAQQATDLANKLAVAKMAADARVNAAQIAAAARKASGSGTKAAKVPASEQIKARADKLGPTVFQQIQTSAADAYNSAYATLNPNPNSALSKIKMPTAADVKAAWQAAHRGKATSVTPLANDYIDSAYK